MVSLGPPRAEAGTRPTGSQVPGRSWC